MNFCWLWSCTEELTSLELARAAEALGRPDEAEDLFRRARHAGPTGQIDPELQ